MVIDRTEELFRYLDGERSGTSERLSLRVGLRGGGSGKGGLEEGEGNEEIGLLRAAASIANSVDSVNQYVAKHRFRYTNFRQGVWVGGGHSTMMSDKERDQVDRFVGDSIRSLMEQLDQLKDASVVHGQRKSSVPGEKGIHQVFVTYMLGIVTVLSERLTKLSTEVEELRGARVRQSFLKKEEDQQRERSLEQLTISSIQRLKDEDPTSSAIADLPVVMQQALEQENEELTQQFSSTRSQVERAEQSVNEIAQLSQLFGIKVIEQAKEIQHLYDEAITTTFTVKRGNREVEQMAQKGNKAIHVIAIFLVVMALSLLFVDFVS
uniref:t-SNARE coiled-coil homology domain-containing protein n=1 Tax=Compsopogon caeruleus TaxID=31354 RepID=A0A7S1XEM6_9RHOD|mmetsp:Transcript_1776/g.3247  ORF Transcript_1776/g.3247 Transcript_1776/m.3247 type:complete len:322 (+) Transcript_1776:95-1060(+)